MTSRRKAISALTNANEENTRKKGLIPFVNVSIHNSTRANSLELKTPNKQKKKMLTNELEDDYGDAYSMIPGSAQMNEREEQKKKQKLCLQREAEVFVKHQKEEDGKEKDDGKEKANKTNCWKYCVEALRQCTCLAEEDSNDVELIANAALWRKGSFFPTFREILVQLPTEESVDSLRKAVVLKKGSNGGCDVIRALLNCLETCAEEIADVHKGGSLAKISKQVLTNTKQQNAVVSAETILDTTELSFAEIIAQEEAAKRKVVEEEAKEKESAFLSSLGRENLSVYETRCPCRRNFEMQAEVRVSCIACPEKQKYEETAMHVSLDMPLLKSKSHPLEVSLRDFFTKTKTIEHRCVKCGADAAEQTRLLKQLPRYLIIHLNRFVWKTKKDDPSVNEKRKIDWRFEIPKTLPVTNVPKTTDFKNPPQRYHHDISSSHADTVSKPKSDGVYDLKVVLANNINNTAEKDDDLDGRTTLHVRNRTIEKGVVKETWTTYDENTIGTSNGRLNETEKFEREAYVLIYSHPDVSR